MYEQEFWQTHLAAIEAEGISTADYARREGLVAQRLYAWRNRLKSENAHAAVNGSGRLTQRSRFVAVEIDAYTTSPDTACTLKLGAGVELQFSGLPDAQWLASLVSASTRAM